MHRKRSQGAVITGDGTVQLNKNVVNGSEPMLRGAQLVAGRFSMDTWGGRVRPDTQ